MIIIRLTLGVESPRIAVQKPFREMHKYPLPLLGFPCERELGEEFPEGHVERIVFEIEITQVFLGHGFAEVVTANRILCIVNVFSYYVLR